MPKRKSRRPSYRYHKARDCAVVTIHGKDHYLGEYDSPESWELYHRLMAEKYAKKEPALPPRPPDSRLTLNELMLRYMAHVQEYYIKDGQPTSEQDTVRQALCFTRRLYGSTPAEEFSPKRLKAVRQAASCSHFDDVEMDAQGCARCQAGVRKNWRCSGHFHPGPSAVCCRPQSELQRSNRTNPN
jgi:hypothetical protein